MVLALAWLSALGKVTGLLSRPPLEAPRPGRVLPAFPGPGSQPGCPAVLGACPG